MQAKHWCDQLQDIIRKAERDAAEAGLEAVADPSRVAEFAAVIAPNQLSLCGGTIDRRARAWWKDFQSSLSWHQRLRDYAYGTIGDPPVDQITVDHIVELLKQIWYN